jgi:hypothetical protein
MRIAETGWKSHAVTSFQGARSRTMFSDSHFALGSPFLPRGLP